MGRSLIPLRSVKRNMESHSDTSAVAHSPNAGGKGSLLRMEGISKIYPGVVANDGVDFEVKEGEIHALLGENGAGKTTLMNVLFGISRPDGGTIQWRDEPVHIHSSRQAIDLGIGMVHQHFMLVEPFTALENIVLGTSTSKGPGLDIQAASARVRDMASRYKLDIDFDSPIEELSLGMRQRAEILKALYRGAHLLILDEPTAVLTPGEVDDLFEILRNLAEHNHAVILISHKLDEVLAVSDRITVLRDGRQIATLATRDATKPKLAELMVGRPVVLDVQRADVETTPEELIKIEDLQVLDTHVRDQLHGVSLRVRGGQVLGIAGVDGNGQRGLWGILFGLRRPTSGTVHLLSREVGHLGPREVSLCGVGRIPEDRSTMGLLPAQSVSENLVLGDYFKEPFSRWGWYRRAEVTAFAQRLVKEYDIRTPTVEVLVSHLSGGNQQKIILARELHSDPKVLIVSNPTRGLDVGAAEYVYERILDMRKRGAAVLLISSDLEEIQCLSDRIAVLYNGRIMGEVTAEEATHEVLGLMMTGTPLERTSRETAAATAR